MITYSRSGPWEIFKGEYTAKMGGGGGILCNMLEALCWETGRSTELPHLRFHSSGRALMATLHTLCFLLPCHLSLHFVLCGDCANMISRHVTQWTGYSPFTAWIRLWSFTAFPILWGTWLVLEVPSPSPHVFVYINCSNLTIESWYAIKISPMWGSNKQQTSYKIAISIHMTE